ncbi:MAG: hypothetical protein WBQ73_00920 [Candidatus Babeliales bacterium]
MEHKGNLEKEHAVLSYLAHLPKRILAFHSRDNVTEFVLHELSRSCCFNLSKAAFFIENPDFDCLKGIAGVSHDHCYQRNDCIWDVPDDFTDHMCASPFNRTVRAINWCSVLRQNDSYENRAEKIARQLSFDDYLFCTWDMKHNNQGLMVYQHSEDDDALISNKHLQDGLSLLGFCPVF